MADQRETADERYYEEPKKVRLTVFEFYPLGPRPPPAASGKKIENELPERPGAAAVPGIQSQEFSS